jgi:hypothetical protein
MINNFLVVFRQYLNTPSSKGSAAPPVSIKASDLDKNFQVVNLLPSEQGVYDAQYTDKGTQLIFMYKDKPAYWQKISLCVNGTYKEMMVLATDPMDPEV